MRNTYPGVCYCCGKPVPPGWGHFERIKGFGWRVKCVKCASGRNVKPTDQAVVDAIRKNERLTGKHYEYPERFLEETKNDTLH